MLRGGLVACVLAVFTLCAGVANAQLPATPAGPLGRDVDSRSVDLASGKLYLNWASIAVGPAGQGGLSYTHGNWWGGASAPFGTMNRSGNQVTVTIGGLSETFTDQGGGAYLQNQGTPSTLAYQSANNSYYYTLRDGTVAIFEHSKTPQAPWIANEGVMVQLIRPNGEILNYIYASYTVGSTPVNRITSIGNNYGYQINFQYASNPVSFVGDANSLTLTKVTAFNRSVEWCDPTAYSCSFTYEGTWPRLLFSNSGQTATDNVGGVTTVTKSGSTVTVARTGLANQTYTLDGSGRVASYSNGLATWNYAWSTVDSDTFKVVITDPLSKTRTVETYLPLMDEERNTATRVITTFQSGRPFRALLPSGQGAEFGYDSRGNATQTIRKSSLPDWWSDIPTYDLYTGSCSNAKTCNQPYRHTDGRGYNTDYSYNASHGGVESVILPPGQSGVQPRYDFSYGQFYAKIKNASGTLVASANPIWLLTGSTHCMKVNCSSNLQNQEATQNYVDSNTNPFVYARQMRAGNFSVHRTERSFLNSLGDVYRGWTDGDGGAHVNETLTRYDALRRVVGTMGAPFVNDSGAPRHLATRITYAPNGQVSMTERGYTTSQDDTGWAAFESLQQWIYAYDTIGRLTRETFTAKGNTAGVTQYAYNARNEVVCVAQRRNRDVFGSLPSDACTASTPGTSGPDVITTYTYDNDGRQLTVSNGGATGGADDVVKTYWADGNVQDVTDAKGNVSRYYWDGHNRLRQLQYPDATYGYTNDGDADTYNYDNGDNLTYVENRQAQVITKNYDNIGRLTSTSFPSETFVYDDSGRMVQVNSPNGSIATTYNAIGQKMSEGGQYGASYQYDVAGRRTRMTWPDGFYVTYEWNAASQLQAIKENGSTTLVSFTYDGFGQRQRKILFNGASTYYSMDSQSRLTKLSLPGSQSINLTYDVARRIKTRISPNAFNWLGHYGVDRSYTVDRLNRLKTSTPVGGSTSTYGYDGRSNIQGDGGGTVATYDQLNRWVSNTANISMQYDGFHRLRRVYNSGSSGQDFGYDGVDLIAEYAAGTNTILRRYVHGPGTDEPLIWYEGSGTGDKRSLIADERGSIILVNNSAGTSIGTVGYDEYGNSTGVVGRFGYTGQAWIPEIGQYYYKARLYAPTLGRFMQTDPIRLGAGMNMYAYVGGDPINYGDPTGLRPMVYRVCASGGGLQDDGTVVVAGCANRVVDVFDGSEAGGVDLRADPATDKLCSLRPGHRACGGNGFATCSAFPGSSAARCGAVSEAIGEQSAVVGGAMLGTVATGVVAGAGVAATTTTATRFALQGWGMGNSKTLMEAVGYHFAKHAASVGTNSINVYAKMATEFARVNAAAIAASAVRSDGSQKFSDGVNFVITRAGQVVSFGAK